MMRNLTKETGRILRHTELGAVLLSARNYFKKNTYVLSYPKCGRTWVATVAMHYVGKRRGLINESLPFSLSPNRDYPELLVLGRRLVFSHGIMNARLRPEELSKRFSLKQFGNKPIALIIRDPRDVVVSYYHHVKQRRQKTNLPEEIDLDEFVHMPEFGLERIVTVYNKMYEFSERQENIEFFRYEDLLGAQLYDVDVWENMFSYIFQEPVDKEVLEWALEINRFESMKVREDPGDRLMPDSRRVRKGKVGGYRDEMSPETQTYVRQVIEESLHDFYRSYKCAID